MAESQEPENHSLTDRCDQVTSQLHLIHQPENFSACALALMQLGFLFATTCFFEDSNIAYSFVNEMCEKKVLSEDEQVLKPALVDLDRLSHAMAASLQQDTQTLRSTLCSISLFFKTKQEQMQSRPIEFYVSSGVSALFCPVCSLGLSQNSSIFIHYRDSHSNCLPQNLTGYNKFLTDLRVAFKAKRRIGGPDVNSPGDPMDESEEDEQDPEFSTLPLERQSDGRKIVSSLTRMYRLSQNESDFLGTALFFLAHGYPADAELALAALSCMKQPTIYPHMLSDAERLYHTFKWPSDWFTLKARFTHLLTRFGGNVTIERKLRCDFPSSASASVRCTSCNTEMGTCLLLHAYKHCCSMELSQIRLAVGRHRDSVKLVPNKDMQDNTAFLTHEDQHHLESLPAEILSNIIIFLDKESLLKLMQCRKVLWQLAEPMVYAEFQETNHKALPTFLRTLLGRPDLAAHTKSFIGKETIHFEDWVSDYPDTEDDYNNHLIAVQDDRDVSGYSDRDWSRVLDAVHRFAPIMVDAVVWTQEIKEGRWDALAALFLCVAPNLEHLEFRHWRGWKRRPLQPRLELMFKRGIFSNLKYLCYSHGEPISSHSLRHLNLKSVTKIKLVGVDDQENDESDLENDEGDLENDESNLENDDRSYPTIKDLTLEKCHINSDWFQKFPVLEKLCCQAPAYNIMEAIQPLKSYLKDLTILNTDDGLSGSLTDFQNLTSINVPSGFLFGEGYDVRRFINSVPSTVEHLILTDVQSYHMNAIFELVSEKAVWTPQLGHLNLHWFKLRVPRRDIFSAEGTTELVSLCNAVGVKLVLEGE